MYTRADCTDTAGLDHVNGLAAELDALQEQRFPQHVQAHAEEKLGPPGARRRRMMQLDVPGE